MPDKAQNPSWGVYCTLKELFDECSRVHNTLHLRRKSRALRGGAQRASVRGRGMDFFESRPYVIQDELKTIDWKVSARFNNLFTKIFIEEKDRPVILSLDFRSHMYFGTKNYFKTVLAAKIAARLAKAAQNGQDPVGALVFNDQKIAQTKTGLRRRDLALCLGLIAEHTKQLPQHPRFPLSSFWQFSLNHLYHRVARGSAVFLISDFAALDKDSHALLYRLRKRVDVFALSLYDPLEEHLPSAGFIGMSYGDTKLYFDSSQKQLQEDYQNYYRESREKKARIFSSLDIPELSFSTADNLDQRFAKLFSGRW